MAEEQEDVYLMVNISGVVSFSGKKSLKYSLSFGFEMIIKVVSGVILKQMCLTLFYVLNKSHSYKHTRRLITVQH